MEFQLTSNQQLIFDMVEATQDNILICGEPGVGKSVLIRALIEEGNKSYVVAAPTGLAALNIGGKTLHSIFRLPISQGIIAPDYDKFPIDDRTLNNIKYNIKHLIIDEISMVRADTFDYIDRLMRYCKNSDKPFGGAQIIAVGDFFQLPPVVVKDESKQLREAGYASPFMFDSAVAKSFKIVELNEVLRQKGDVVFLDILAAARTGSVVPSHVVSLNKRVTPLEGLRIVLAGTNKQAEEINRGKLQAINDSPVSYGANKFGEWPALPAEEFLTLKVGAQVMVKMNGADRPEGFKGDYPSQVVNGTLGFVFELQQDRVVVMLKSGDCVTIYRRRWERKVKEKVEGVWEEKIVASFEQIPLALAWAISIHKSQGQTFDQVHIDASRIFAAGQLYVALSRARTLAGITLQSKVDARKFFADRNVIRFFNSIEV